jgi:hypothetical protein
MTGPCSAVRAKFGMASVAELESMIWSLSLLVGWMDYWIEGSRMKLIMQWF